MPLRLPLIYPITDKRISGKHTHLAILKQLADAGASLVQIRDKETPLPELLLDLRRCVAFCRERSITLIVNDRCDLALSCGADGVHLGQEDLPPLAARTVLGDRRLIGYSTHNARQVRQTLHLPIQYIGFGPVYATTTKATRNRVVGLDGLKRACLIAQVPVVAIGGIGAGEIRAVLDAGAASAAVVSSLMSAKSIARKMEFFLKIARGKE
jgi:thiamine-phosphate diphosphorylase